MSEEIVNLPAFYNADGTISINVKAAGIDDEIPGILMLTADKAAVLASHLIMAARDAKEDLECAIGTAEDAARLQK